MANTQSPYPPYRPTPPPPQHPSPPLDTTGPYAPPPAKRPRLSPDPRSPPTYSPTLPNGALQNPAFQRDVLPAPRYEPAPRALQPAVAPRPLPMPVPIPAPAPLAAADASPAGSPPPSSMPPPQRPEQREQRVDFTDVLGGTGIDEREEEANLLRSRTLDFGGGAASPDDTPYGGDLGGPLGGPALNLPGDRRSFYGQGNANQPPETLEGALSAMERARRRQLRRGREMQQYHMRDPFLLGTPVWQHLCAQSQQAQVTLPDPQAVRRPYQNHHPVQMNVVGPEGHDNVVLLRGENLLCAKGDMGELIGLVSLAARERVRAVVEDAALRARGRRATAHGVVPPDLLDLAVGRGTPAETTVRPESAGSSGKKRPFAELDPPDPLLTDPLLPQPEKTVAYPNMHVSSFAGHADAERKADAARAAKRARRTASGLLTSAEAAMAAASGQPSRAASVSGTATPSGSTPAAGGAASTPGAGGGEAEAGGTMGLVAPSSSSTTGGSRGAKPPTKKELKRRADARTAEAQSSATAQAANMALGGSGGPAWLGGKKIGWLNSKSGAAASGTFGGGGARAAVAAGGGAGGSGGAGSVTTGAGRRGSGVGGAVGGRGAAAVGMAGSGGARDGFGTFREDREGGRGVQLRDLLAVLKPDQLESRVLQRLVQRMNRSRA